MTVIVVDCRVEHQMTIAVMQKGEPMSDLISRQAAIDALNKLDVSDGVGISSVACYLQEEALRSIENLPSVQSERKTGKWIQAEDITTEYAVCTNCKGHGEFYMDYCWHCGARMECEEE